MSKKSVATMVLETNVVEEPSFLKHVQENDWQEIHHDSPARLRKGEELKLVGIIGNTDLPDVKKDESSIEGIELLMRLRQLKADLSKEDAKELWCQRDRIPEEWREDVLMTSYVVKDVNGDLRVLYFYWYGDQWRWDFFYVRCQFDAVCRGVALASNSSDS